VEKEQMDATLQYRKSLGWRVFRQDIWLSMRTLAATPFYWVFFGAIALFLVTATYFLNRIHAPVYYFDLMDTSLNGGLFLLVFFVLFARFTYAVSKREADALDYIYMDFADAFNLKRVLPGVCIVLSLEIFFAVFLDLKKEFPVFVPFYADPFLSNLDKTIHFGKHPWEWLAPIFKNPYMIILMDNIYMAWFPLKFSVLFWQSFVTKDNEGRATFFLAYLFSWIINAVAVAMMFSSVGPCFYGLLHIGGIDPYADQVAFLADVNNMHALSSIVTQGILWNNYVEPSASLVSGISAFPSMHISVALLYCLMARKYHRNIRIFFWGFLGCVMVGSVVLAWHYAVDGYFSILSTTAIWFSVDYLVRRFNLSKPFFGKEKIASPS
jgi:hypothetical protein